MIPPLPNELYLLFDFLTFIKESVSYLDFRNDEEAKLFIIFLIAVIFVETLTESLPRQGFFYTQQENAPTRNQTTILNEHGPEAESMGLGN